MSWIRCLIKDQIIIIFYYYYYLAQTSLTRLDELRMVNGTIHFKQGLAMLTFNQDYTLSYRSPLPIHLELSSIKNKDLK